MRLQTGLAVSDRFGEQLRGDRVNLIGFHAVGAAPTGKPALRLADTCGKLARIGPKRSPTTSASTR